MLKGRSPRPESNCEIVILYEQCFPLTKMCSAVQETKEIVSYMIKPSSYGDISHKCRRNVLDRDNNANLNMKAQTQNC